MGDLDETIAAALSLTAQILVHWSNQSKACTVKRYLLLGTNTLKNNVVTSELKPPLALVYIPAQTPAKQRQSERWTFRAWSIRLQHNLLSVGVFVESAAEVEPCSQLKYSGFASSTSSRSPRIFYPQAMLGTSKCSIDLCSLKAEGWNVTPWDIPVAFSQRLRCFHTVFA